MEAPKDSVARLVFELNKLPGVGEKTATRLAHFILKQDSSYARSLADALVAAKENIRLCSVCLTFTNHDPCYICSNSKRMENVICVVEKPSDVFSIEQSMSFQGKYHILHGVLSPLDGIGPEDLKIRELMGRVSRLGSQLGEIIIATNPTVEGDATALYLAKLIQPLGVRVTKLAHGIPVGGQLEYSDRQTIGKALENRVEITAH